MNPELYQPLNDYFDQIYVLTLKRATERRAHIEQALKGLDYRIFWGTDAKELDAETLAAAADQKTYRRIRRAKRNLSDGEIGCAMSHRAIHQDVVDQGYERVLILEDDVVPDTEHMAAFSNMMAEAPSDWDCLLLGYRDEKRDTNPKHRRQRDVYLLYRQLRLFQFHLHSKKWLKNMCATRVNQHFWHVGRLVGAHAYAITGETARKFVDYQTPIVLQSDRLFYYLKIEQDLKAYFFESRPFTLCELSQVSYIGYKKTVNAE